MSHLESAIDGTALDHTMVQTTHAGRPLWVRYDLDAVAATMTKQAVAQRAPDMWRYRELLPVADGRFISSLGEGMTPLIKCERLGAALGLGDLWVKDESQLPTGSFKSRGLSMAVSRANELGVGRVAIPTAGNAGGAMAAYAARVGMDAYVFMPADTPIVNQYEAVYYGAHAFLVDGMITDCGASRSRRHAPHGMVRHVDPERAIPNRRQEDDGPRASRTVRVVPARRDHVSDGWRNGPHRNVESFRRARRDGLARGRSETPNDVVSGGGVCPHQYRLGEQGNRFAEPFPDPETAASGLRVPVAVGDFMILDAVRQSGGQARSCSEESLLCWASDVERELEGIAFAPESWGLPWACSSSWWPKERSTPDERVVVFNTGAAQKYVEVLAATPLPHLPDPMDWEAFAMSNRRDRAP